MLLGHPSDPMAKVSGDNSMAEKRGALANTLDWRPRKTCAIWLDCLNLRPQRWNSHPSSRRVGTGPTG